MTLSQRKLVWSWGIGGITLIITAYMLETNDSYTWVTPMLIGMLIVKYLREGMDNDKRNIFHHMSEKMKLFIAIYLLILAGFVVYSVMVTPEFVGNNVGIIMVLALAPFIIVFIKIDLKLYIELGEKNT